VDDDYALSVEAAGAELPPALAVYAAHLLRRAYIRGNSLAPRFTGSGGTADARDFQILDALSAPAAYSQQDLGERLGINRTTMVKLIEPAGGSRPGQPGPQPGGPPQLRPRAQRRRRSAIKAMEPAVSAADDRLTTALTPRRARPPRHPCSVRCWPAPRPRAASGVRARLSPRRTTSYAAGSRTRSPMSASRPGTSAR